MSRVSRPHLEGRSWENMKKLDTWHPAMYRRRWYCCWHQSPPLCHISSIGYVRPAYVLRTVRAWYVLSLQCLLSHLWIICYMHKMQKYKIRCPSLVRHVLQTYLAGRTETAYNLRNRTHNKSLINKTSHLNEKDFIIRMLYKDTY